MGAKIRTLIVFSVFVFVFFWASGPANEWFSRTMPRHQVLQLPLMFGLGILLEAAFPKVVIRSFPWCVAILVLVLGALIFWMLPRSIDWAALDPGFNRIMHVTMVAAGFASLAALRRAPEEMRMAFLGMISAMLLAVGFTLRTFEVLLCSAFTVEQQKETGMALVGIGATLLLITMGSFLRGLRRR